jgi:hypothetical protein
MPEMRMNSLKSFAMNCGPLSVVLLGMDRQFVNHPPGRQLRAKAEAFDEIDNLVQ